MLGHLTDYWGAHYNIDIAVSSKFACEIDPAKQAFLQQQHGATLMFEDVGDLHKFKAKNVVTGQMAVVPVANAFGFGGSCTTRSPASQHSSANRSCIVRDDESAATCATWEGGTELY